MNTATCSRVFLLLALAAHLAITAAAAAAAIPFAPDRWELKDAEVKEFLGRPALAGTAWLKDVVFEDGVIEVDVAADRGRAYPAIIFRRQAEGEYEHVYLRPHRAGLYPDALQYAPVFNGVGGWQLYSGPGFTAPVTLAENQWVHVRLEVLGTQARIFVGDGPQPALVVGDLKHGRSRGAIGLQCPRDSRVRFARFLVTAADGLHFDPPPAADPIPGILTAWELSPAASVFDLAPERLFDGAAAAAIPWLSAKSETSGLVDIARHRKPVARGASRVWARTTIHAAQAGPRPFAFGYSDDVSVYLNGRLLYRGRNGYRSRDPSYLGIIGCNDTLLLPLEAGDNELVLGVAEQFGGWGFMVRDLDAIYCDSSLQPVWELAGQLAAPESVAFDAARGTLYVSNFGDGTIAKIGLDGAVVARKWLEGLRAPTGLKMHAGRLYAVERPGVAVIDPDQGAIVERLTIPEARFPNDLAISEDGTIFVTDSFKDCVHRLSGGKAEIWIEGRACENPNGILIEKDRLMVGVTADGTLRTVDLKTKQVDTFLTLGAGANMDGLVADGRGGYLFSDYYGRIYRADARGRRTLLLDRRGPRQYTADFEFIPEKGLLVVPSLYDNRLTAYRLTAP